MKNVTLIAALLVLGCGRADLFEPVDETPAPVTAPAPEPTQIERLARICVADTDFATSRWECETVSALEVVSLVVTNADGSAPWTAGAPRVSGVMRNTTGHFLNYPSLQISASEPSLTPGYARDSLYGMFGCDEAELSMTFRGTAVKGSAVTFSAIPAHINSDACALTRPPVTLTVTAP